MKIVCGLVLFFTLIGAQAFELKIRKMRKVRGMERQFILKTNLEDQVVLDCQSFIQGLSIGGQESGQYFMLEPFECENLYHRVKESLNKSEKHCVEIEEDLRSDYTCP